MKTLALLLSLLISQLTFAQEKYQKAMGEALATWGQGKHEEAMRKMERIASAEKDNWIPRYYQALIAAMSSFQEQDPAKKMALLKISYDLIPQDNDKSNAEWHILKATALSSELMMDPMNNATRLFPLIISNYEKAKALEPNNPRAISGLASFNIHSKKYMGGNTDQEYKDLQKALSLFNDQKSDIPFYPTWGKEQVEKMLNENGKK